MADKVATVELSSLQEYAGLQFHTCGPLCFTVLEKVPGRGPSQVPYMEAWGPSFHVLYSQNVPPKHT